MGMGVVMKVASEIIAFICLLLSSGVVSVINLLFKFTGKKKGAKYKQSVLPFFVKGQVRRRKLDMTRKSNFLVDSIGEKGKRAIGGILRLKRKKRR